MHSALRTSVTGLLVVCLAAAPLQAATAQPLGVIYQTSGSQVSGAEAIAGTTIFTGDHLSTAGDGVLHVRLGRQQLYLLASSSVSLDAGNGGPRAHLQAGTAGFSAPAGSSFQMMAAGAVVRPAGERAAAGEVKLLGASEILVTSYHGSLNVAWNGETLAVPEGKAYHLRLEAETQDKGPSAPGAAPPFAANATMMVIGILLIAGTIAGVVASNTGKPVSPSSP